MGGKATLSNKWHQERLLKTEVKPGLIQNIPNQTYLNVNSPALTPSQVIIDLVSKENVAKLLGWISTLSEQHKKVSPPPSHPIGTPRHQERH